MTLAEADVLDLLTSLVDKSLVVREEVGSGRGRFDLLETVRSYGQEHCERVEDVGHSVERHLRYLISLTRRAGDIKELAIEQGNIQGVLARQAHSSHVIAVLRLRLATELEDYWQLMGLFDLGLSSLRQAIDDAAPAPIALGAAARHACARLHLSQGDAAAARSIAAESVELYRRANDEPGLAHALCLLASIAACQGDLDAAESFTDQALELAERLGDERLRHEAILEHGYQLMFRREYESAQAMFERALLYRRAAQHPLGGVLNLLARCLYDKGDLERAREVADEALALRRRIGNRIGVAWTRLLLAQIAAREGALAVATTHLDAALAFCLDVRDKSGMLLSLYTAVDLMTQFDRPTEAAELLGTIDACREPIAFRTWFDRSEVHREVVHQVRSALEEDAYNAARRRGSTRALTEAVCVARSLIAEATP